MEVQQQYEKVHEYVRNHEIGAALEIVEQILKQNPEDKDALYIKQFLLIKEEKFTLALQVLNKLQDKSNELELDYPKAYCFYRLNKLKEANDIILNSNQKQDVSFKKLWAQITLKSEDFETCLKIYEELLQITPKNDPDYVELLTNYQAAYASYYQQNLHLYGEEIKYDNDKAYELLFNSANLLIAKGEFNLAEKKLKEAESLCRTTLSNSDYSSTEIEQELAPILVQLAYIHQMQGDTAESIKVYRKILDDKTADEPTKVVIKNNLIMADENEANKLENVHQLNKILNGESTQRLTNAQKLVILKNQVVLYLSLGMYHSARNVARKISYLDESSSAQVIVSASILLLQGYFDKAIIELKNNYKKDPKNIQIGLSLSHLYSKQNQFESAILVLENLYSNLNLAKSKFLPGLIGTMLWLYEILEKDSEAEQLLQQAYQSASPYSELYKNIMKRKSAENKFKNSQVSEAAKSYQELLEQDPNDINALSGLIRALSLTDSDRAEQYLAQLPKPQIFEDVSHLEARFTDVQRFVHTATSTEPRQLEVKKKKNRRHNKPPKNINSGAKIDLQRWLPMRDRTYYRNKNKKKQIRGSQGAATVVKEKETVLVKEDESAAKTKPKKIKKKIKIIRH